MNSHCLAGADEGVSEEELNSMVDMEYMANNNAGHGCPMCAAENAGMIPLVGVPSGGPPGLPAMVPA